MGKKTKSPKDEFIVSLKLGDKTFEGTGKTALAALSAMPKPDKIVSKGILTISQGDAKRELLLWPIRLKRLFYSPTYQAIQAKYLTMGLK
jgi:hypothetical protein